MARFTCNECGMGFEGKGCNCDALPEAIAESQPGEYVDLLATMFLGGLAKTLSQKDFHEFCRRTAHEYDEVVCYSHDYCDANVVMMDAFHLTVGRELDLQDEGDEYLVNAAWNRMKRFLAGKEN